ncbi:MAG: NUDIX domain-containing protein, partial [Armatimonadetes bacterium]|nr:NUDIX domain-containing protein [Armatimonadota bacterium]
VRKDESPEAAAIREVREETGLDAEIEAPLPPVEYWYFWKRGGANVRHHKRVDFFLMRALGGHLEDHDAEVIEARWFPLTRAIAEATYPSERDVLRAAAEALRTGRRRPRKVTTR